MLLSLRIENFAIISSTKIDFSKGFNVLTGETGAGKSILMEALGLILGNRSQKTMIRQGFDKAEIEAVFSTENPRVEEILRDNGFDYEDLLILQKTIYRDRPTISRLNGRGISNTILSQITSLLADSTHQQENQKLLSSHSQIKILDDFIGNEQKILLTDLNRLMDQYKELDSFLHSENIDERARIHEVDLLRFQLDELNEANICDKEDEELEKKQKKIMAHSKIVGSLSFLYNLENGEMGLRTLMEKYLHEVTTLERFDPIYSELSQRIEGLKFEWFEVFNEISHLMDSLDFDENELQKIETRLDTINRLKRKYGNSYYEIMEKKKQMEDRLAFLNDFDKEMEKKKEERNRLEAQAKTIAVKLSQNRKNIAKVIQDIMVEELKELNIPNGKFSIQFEESELSKRGIDKISYLISTNIGEKMQPLSVIASGGEMSRILLAFKSIMAKYDETETLIFDEIDSGMGGKTARIVGEKMQKLSKKAQLIVISHLPQVVSLADEQFQIVKEQVDNRTNSTLKKLNYDERVDYLATMISGSDHQVAIETAKNMLLGNI